MAEKSLDGRILSIICKGEQLVHDKLAEFVNDMLYQGTYNLTFYVTTTEKYSTQIHSLIKKISYAHISQNTKI